jgi:hypothetical protein
MDWASLRAELEARVKPLASTVGDAIDAVGLRIAEWGPIQQYLRDNGRYPPSLSRGTSSISSRISGKMTASVTTIDLLALATSLPYAGEISTFSTGIENVTFHSYDNAFASILGSNASWRMIANESYEAFHEAGVYHQATNSLYISSNWASEFTNPINISILNLNDYSLTSQRYTGLASPNGGTAYVTPGTEEQPQLLFCDEGNFEVASALTIVDPLTQTTKVRVIEMNQEYTTNRQ